MRTSSSCLANRLSGCCSSSAAAVATGPAAEAGVDDGGGAGEGPAAEWPRPPPSQTPLRATTMSTSRDPFAVQDLQFADI